MHDHKSMMSAISTHSYLPLVYLKHFWSHVHHTICAMIDEVYMNGYSFHSSVRSPVVSGNFWLHRSRNLLWWYQHPTVWWPLSVTTVMWKM